MNTNYEQDNKDFMERRLAFYAGNLTAIAAAVVASDNLEELYERVCPGDRHRRPLADMVASIAEKFAEELDHQYTGQADVFHEELKVWNAEAAEEEEKKELTTNQKKEPTE